MRAVTHELKQAARGLLAKPGFSALVIAVLSSGLACVLFMAVLVYGLVIRPLPFAAPEQLLHIGLQKADRPDRLSAVSTHDLIDWQRQLDAVVDVAAYQQQTINLSDEGRAERYAGALITSNLLRVIGVPAQLGRTFTAEDAVPGAPATVILSDAVWRQRYNADPAIIGRVLRMNAGSASVIGVMPADFSYPQKEMLWTPAPLKPGTTRDEGGDWVVIARLRAAAGMSALRAALDNWHADAKAESPRYFEMLGVGVEPLSYLIVDRNTRAIFNVMLVAVLLVLLVACANAANLMLSRTLARRQELAVRAALGASRARLAGHLLGQSLVLAAVAAAIALPVGWAAARWVDQTFRNSEEGPPHWMHFNLDAALIGYTVLAALLTGVISGILPALRAGSQVNATLRDDSRAVAGGAFARISRGLVIGEVAISCVLLVAAGVMVRGIDQFESSDFGIRTDNLLTARIGVPEVKFPSAEAQLAVFDRLEQALRAEPGVIDAGIGTTLPGLIAESRRVLRDGAGPDDAQTVVYFGRIDDHFASTYELGLEEGRFFNSSDDTDSPAVALVDRTFADKLGGGESVLGRRFRIDPDNADAALVTIVGVIRRVQLDDLDDAVRPAMLRPLRQDPARFVSLAIRTQGDPLAFAPRFNEILREVEPDTPAYWVRSYDQVIREGTFGEFVLARLFLVFGGISLFLAGAGVYGVIAFNVRQRTREIGVRRALGAPAANVLRSLLGRGAWQIGLGLLLGLTMAWLFARALVSSLNGFDADNPAVYGAVIGILMLAALIAILVPARRALRVDPLVALRHE
ncbi:MAG: ADOP family duplicated permease [Dokdonella sp.]|uniref:ADOP family duplicated permease n=1 Tax=Dokdonella sp. TaxID=2291710 RepID=UPI003BB048DB